MSGLSPISFEFVAAGVARRARVALAHLVPSQVNKEVPSWKGHDGTIEGAEVATPITDRTFWESRYVLTELILCKENGETLVVNDAVVTVTQEKHIVRTTLVGLNGTIKEYICNGDYDISISVGIVAVDSNGQIVDEYPKEGIRKIREFLDENKNIIGYDRDIIAYRSSASGVWSSRGFHSNRKRRRIVRRSRCGHSRTRIM